MINPEIEVYGKMTCGYCMRAKNLLSSKELAYTYKDVERNPEYLDEMRHKTDARTLPQIFWDDRYIGGYDDLSKYLKEKDLNKD